MLTHASLLAAVTATAAARPVAADAIYGYPFPLCHVAGYNVLLHHHHGRPVVLLPGFSPTVLCEAIARHEITTISLAPTMVASLLDDPALSSADLSSLRAVSYGASAMPTEVLRLAVERLGCDFTQGYGMTELSGNAVFLGAEEHRRALTDRPHLLGAAGRTAPGVDLRILDDGEIAIRAPQVMAGYWEDPDATEASLAPGGWFRTGDVGRLDDDGYLYVVDRKKDVIVTGGENVASREVEDVLHLHPSVAAAAVVGVPDRTWGERVAAFVVPRPGETIDATALEALVREHLAGYKVPRLWEVVDELPANASGKVLKRELRDRLTRQADRPRPSSP
jgi:acyl-CoA synthetase (AMP-forming)/AMP-acid ligase II